MELLFSDEVEHRPEVLDVILQGCAREQKATAALLDETQLLEDHVFRIAQSVSLKIGANNMNDNDVVFRYLLVTNKLNLLESKL
jgi:hypothetical protein